MARPVEDLSGRRFGALTAVRYEQPKKRWLCRCDCGEERLVVGSNLKQGKSSSCGCQKGNTISAKKTRHGHSRGTRHRESAEYRAWAAISTRCYNPNDPATHNYAGRGITVCDRWRESFEAFLADMGERPGPEYSIDRIDNSRGYEPENCRWATKKQQARNTRHNVMLTVHGETLCMTEWAERSGVSAATIQKRLRLGWSHEDAVMRPVTTPSKVIDATARFHRDTAPAA